jgi:hypothetical protein
MQGLFFNESSFSMLVFTMKIVFECKQFFHENIFLMHAISFNENNFSMNTIFFNESNFLMQTIFLMKGDFLCK